MCANQGPSLSVTPVNPFCSFKTEHFGAGINFSFSFFLFFCLGHKIPVSEIVETIPILCIIYFHNSKIYVDTCTSVFSDLPSKNHVI